MGFCSFGRTTGLSHLQAQGARCFAPCTHVTFISMTTMFVHMALPFQPTPSVQKLLQSLQPHETNYIISELGSLGLVWAVKMPIF